MAGQLAASMTADAPRDDDIPDRPVFVNISDDEEDDEDELPPVKEPQKQTPAKRTPIVQPSTPSASTYRPTAGSTYRPSYVPPAPVVSPTVHKPKFTVDQSKVQAGTIVTHKAFGTGQVKGIDGAIIVVTFNGEDKRFQFPWAFEQGFLKLDE